MESKKLFLLDKLDVSNPHVFRFSHPSFGVEVLGGIRLDALDRLRVTLKIENQQGRAIRNNLDLYHDSQVEKFVRRAAEKLESRTAILSSLVNDLTSVLEVYRTAELSALENKKAFSKVLSSKEIRMAEAFLKSPYLMKSTNEKIGDSGVIGEVDNRLLMFIAFTSRKRAQPLHVVSLGSSGIGKTHLQESVGRLIPEEDKVEITTLSDNAFYYFDRTELSHKLILIEDLDGAQQALYPLRELQSKKRISKTVAHRDARGETSTVHLQVEGPVSVSGCTTREHLYEDNANRSFLLYLDESSDQDERIMEYQRALSAGLVDLGKQVEAIELLQNTQRVLKPISVRNPYAPFLKIPKEVFKPRRTNSHYLQFIEAITFYHQFQREQKADPITGEIFIETTLEDIQWANQLLKKVLLHKSDAISGACRNYFEVLKTHLKEENMEVFSNRELSQALSVPYSTIKRYHLELLNHGHIAIASKNKQRNRGYEYKVVDAEAYACLRKQMDNSLDKVLESLKTPSS